MVDARRVGSETESDVEYPELAPRQPVLVPVLFVDKAELPKFLAHDYKGPWALCERFPTTKTDKQRGEGDCVPLLAPRCSMTCDCFNAACTLARGAELLIPLVCCCYVPVHVTAHMPLTLELEPGVVLQEMEQRHSGRSYSTGCSYSHMCIG